MNRKKQIELYRDIREYCLSLSFDELADVYDELWAKKDNGEKLTTKEIYTEQICNKIYEMIQWETGDCDDFESDLENDIIGFN